MENTILLYFTIIIIHVFLIESTDMSDHNSDQPEEDPKCQNVNIVCILCMWALVHMIKLTVALLLNARQVW